MVATYTYNEQQLLKELTQGNFSAFEYLFKQYYTALCNHALSFSGDAASAEDAVSDVFARIWERRSQLNIDLSVKSYLYRAVTNQCIDTLRKSYRKRVVLTDNLPAFAQTPDSVEVSLIPETREITEKVELAVRNLPKQCGIIFRLSREAGLKYQEIANHLGISVKTVETQMSRAFKSLRGTILTPELHG
jgi:RNA polymerase sigma-70 factor (family 1)